MIPDMTERCEWEVTGRHRLLNQHDTIYFTCQHGHTKVWVDPFPAKEKT